MSYQFIANVIIKGKIETLTGMHIGGSKEKLEIGGVDSPVIRDPNTNQPYIPGSSLKGKMRMLLEYSLGNVIPGKTYESKNINDEVCRIFGNFEKGTQGGPTRLVVRDAFPDKETVMMWEELDSELLYTELKPENSIDRLTSEANPRFLERVVKSSKFNFELVYGIYNFAGDEGKTDKDYLKYVLQAMKLLEHSGIGGNISRGYGQIKFRMAKPIIVKREDYISGNGNYEMASKEPESLEYSLDLNSPEFSNLSI